MEDAVQKRLLSETVLTTCKVMPANNKNVDGLHINLSLFILKNLTELKKSK